MLSRLDDLRQVEAKYPALLFKQQLTAFLEKIYGMIRDSLKKEISPLLGLCIQVYAAFYNLMCWFKVVNVISFCEKISKCDSVSYMIFGDTIYTSISFPFHFLLDDIKSTNTNGEVGQLHALLFNWLTTYSFNSGA